MATANDLITTSLRRARIIGKDQTPTSDEAADALAEMNRMLDEWWNDRLAVFYIKQEQFTLASGQATRTIGPTGNYVTTRPLGLVSGCFTRRDGVDKTLTVLQARELYDGISVKSASGQPQFVFYSGTMPDGTLYFWPTPDAADAVYLNSQARLQSVSALTTDISLPPGYESLIIMGLAVRLAPEYGTEAPLSVRLAFSKAMKSIKRTNSPSPVMGFDAAALPRKAGYSIYEGP